MAAPLASAFSSRALLQNRSSLDSEDLWDQIIMETTAATKEGSINPETTILVLGDEGSGKSALLARLKKTEVGTVGIGKSMGLDYSYLDVYGPDDASKDDVVSRINLWEMQGESAYLDLLPFAVNADNINRTMVLIVLDWSQPWTFKESLEKWTKMLEDHIATVNNTLTEDEVDKRKQSLVSFWTRYVEPERDRAKLKEGYTVEDTRAIGELSEGALTQNLGVPILVVCTKADTIPELSFRDQHFDYIQRYLRTYCLAHGAGLLYVSARETRQCGMLHEYCLHVLYGFPFSEKAQVLDNDSTFVPVGYDSLKKIEVVANVLNRGTGGAAGMGSYSEVIPQPFVRKLEDEVETTVEDEQTFLARQKTQLDSQRGTAITRTRPTDADPAPLSVSTTSERLGQKEALKEILSSPSAASAIRNRSSSVAAAPPIDRRPSGPAIANVNAASSTSATAPSATTASSTVSDPSSAPPAGGEGESGQLGAAYLFFKHLLERDPRSSMSADIRVDAEREYKRMREKRMEEKKP